VSPACRPTQALPIGPSASNPEELARLFQALPKWATNHDLTDDEQQRLLATARTVQQAAPATVRKAIDRFMTDTDEYDPLDREFAETKLFLLMRVVFDLPESVPAADMAYFKGYLRPESALRNPSWPISWTEGKPQVVDRCVGSRGGRYLAADEYDFLLTRYRFRKL
jgi:hypothetical protein